MFVWKVRGLFHFIFRDTLTNKNHFSNIKSRFLKLCMASPVLNSLYYSINFNPIWAREEGVDLTTYHAFY